MSAALLELRGLGRGFNGVAVLRGIDLVLEAGCILGLVGENGAGKSTLMNLVGGVLQPDQGEMLWEGTAYCPKSPLEAARRGVAVIHQELNLFPNLSVEENLLLTALPTCAGGLWIDRSALRARALGIVQELGLGGDLARPVQDLSAGERQLLEVAKALVSRARLILFDEPTSSLSLRECERLFALMREFKAKGVAMVFISHALEDVSRLCDKIAVLRDGHLVACAPTSQFDRSRLVALMIGRELKDFFPARSGRLPGPPVLSVRGLGAKVLPRALDFVLHEGEVLGVFGLMGAGRTEMARLLFGLEEQAQGELWLGQRQLRDESPSERVALGMAYLPENRQSEGLCLEASVAENLLLCTLTRHANRWGWLLRRRIAESLARLRQEIVLDAKVSLEQSARSLSGGNQQKLVLGKWLLAEPRVLLLDEPTRGVDVGAKYELYTLIQALAGRGAGVLMISSDLEELLGVCDRLLVMHRGRAVATLARSDFERERILALALGLGRERREGRGDE